VKINDDKKPRNCSNNPTNKQETDTEIESKSETDTEIKSKPERERERDKERERQSKTENEWEKDREQPPVPSNGVFQAAPVAVKGLSLEISSGKRGEEKCLASSCWFLSYWVPLCLASSCWFLSY